MNDPEASVDRRSRIPAISAVAVVLIVIVYFTFFRGDNKEPPKPPPVESFAGALKGEGLIPDEKALRQAAPERKTAEFSLLAGRFEFRHFTVEVSGVPVQVLEFQNDGDALSAFRILKGAESLYSSGYLVKGPLVVQIRFWRYKYSGGKIIGVEKIGVDPNLPCRIRKALLNAFK